MCEQADRDSAVVCGVGGEDVSVVSAEGHGSFNDLIHYWRALLGGDNIHRHRYQSYVRIRP